jgi:hypothetical protein
MKTAQSRGMWVPLVAACAALAMPLAAQKRTAEEPKAKPTPRVADRTVADKPVRFSQFPVADEAPLDADAAIERAVAQLLVPWAMPCQLNGCMKLRMPSPPPASRNVWRSACSGFLKTP